MLLSRLSRESCNVRQNPPGGAQSNVGRFPIGPLEGEGHGWRFRGGGEGSDVTEPCRSGTPHSLSLTVGAPQEAERLRESLAWERFTHVQGCGGVCVSLPVQREAEEGETRAWPSCVFNPGTITCGAQSCNNRNHPIKEKRLEIHKISGSHLELPCRTEKKNGDTTFSK